MRFTESDYHNPLQMDFVPRERRSQMMQLILAFAVAIALVFISGFALHSNPVLSVLASAGVIAMLCVFVLVRKQQNLDLVMSTEYQNMLFAQAAALGWSFCLFVRRDGTVVYSNDGLRKIFPHATYGDSHALGTIFERGGVSQPDRERLMAAVYSGKTERLIFPIAAKDGASQDYILTIEPLERPGEFLVIRGREYRDTRAGLQVLPDALRATSPEKIDFLLTNTPVAIYTTDEFGQFEYTNPAFDQMLGYMPGDFIGLKYGLKQIFHQLNGQPLGEDYTPADVRGDALLKRRDSSLASVRLQQAILRDETGKSRGAVGSALLIGASRSA